MLGVLENQKYGQRIKQKKTVRISFKERHNEKPSYVKGGRYVHLEEGKRERRSVRHIMSSEILWTGLLLSVIF